MTYFKAFFVDFLVPLGWPIVALVFLAYFRTGISEVLRRVTVAGPSDIKAFPPNQTSSPTAIKTEAQYLSSPAPFPPDPSLAHWKDPITTALTTLEKTDNAETIKQRLILALAYAQREATFENLARTIFGSQIAALRFLKDPGVGKAELKRFWQTHQERATAAKITPVNFEVWLGFLLRNNLVIPDGPTDKHQITGIGRKLVSFLDTITVNEATKTL